MRPLAPMSGIADAKAEQAAAAIGVIKKRSDFLNANRGRRHAAPGFVLLDHVRGDGVVSCEADAIRYGITVTKKVGNAVVRNRIKRRFRELARALLPAYGRPGHDYVLIGRAGSIERDFSLLTRELEQGLARLAAGKGDAGRPPKRRRSRDRRSEGTAS